MRLIDADALPIDIDYHDVEDAPTIGGWIPCSERLPESGRYLVDTCLNVFSPNILNYDSDTNKWFYDGCKSMDIEIPFVFAWMPLPEPYREDGEE